MRFMMFTTMDLGKLASDINNWLMRGNYAVRQSQLVAVPEKTESIMKGQSHTHVFVMSVFYEET